MANETSHEDQALHHLEKAKAAMERFHLEVAARHTAIAQAYALLRQGTR